MGNYDDWMDDDRWDYSHPENKSSSETDQPVVPILNLEDRIATFWQAGPAIDTYVGQPQQPSVDKTLLKCLGEAPFTIKRQNLSELLAQAYDQIRLTTQESMEHQVMIVETLPPAENGENSKL